jgi:hypothetical protein
MTCRPNRVKPKYRRAIFEKLTMSVNEPCKLGDCGEFTHLVMGPVRNEQPPHESSRLKCSANAGA